MAAVAFIGMSFWLKWKRAARSAALLLLTLYIQYKALTITPMPLFFLAEVVDGNGEEIYFVERGA